MLFFDIVKKMYIMRKGRRMVKSCSIGFRNMRELFLAEIVRDGRLIYPIAPSEVIEADENFEMGIVKTIQWYLQKYKGSSE